MNNQRAWISDESIALEKEALPLLHTRAAMDSMDMVAARWNEHVNPDEGLKKLFDREFKQAAFAAALRAVNCDPMHPKIHALGRFEHTVDGDTIPGTNYGHGNPDCIYRFIPVDQASTYRLSGTFPGKRPVATEVSLVDAKQVFLGNISTGDLVVDEAGRFSVTLSPAPDPGATNCLRNVPGAHSLCVRDIIGDARIECPALLTIERVDASPLTGNGCVAQHAEEVFPRFFQQLVEEIFAFEDRILRPMPVNTFSSPTAKRDDTLLPSQAFSMGRVAIGAETAIVISVSLGGASYFVLPITNPWGGLGGFPAHVGVLNNFTAVPDDDGRFTFVLSLADPGIANWIDPDGVPTGVIVARWIDFARDRVGAGPELNARITRFSALSDILPAGVRRCEPAARAVQRDAHRRRYLTVKG